jgi:transcriptional regulator with XRE-family HTH domain
VLKNCSKGGDAKMYDEKCLQQLGNNIRFLRTACQLSQQELAKRIGVSQTHLSNIEHSHVKVTLKLLLRIANVFDCTLENIFDAKTVPEWVEARAAKAKEHTTGAQEVYTREEVQQILQLLHLYKNGTS